MLVVSRAMPNVGGTFDTSSDISSRSVHMSYGVLSGVLWCGKPVRYWLSWDSCSYGSISDEGDCNGRANMI